MNDETLSLSLRRAAGLARQFLHWWGAELGGLIPRRLRRRLTASSRSVRFELLASRLLLRTHGAGRRQTLGAWDLDRADATPADEIALAVRRSSGRGAAVVVRPAPGQVFRCTLFLPERAEDHLAEVLAFEIDRQTPFRPDRVFSTHRLVARHPETERIEVELVVVPRRSLAPVLDIIERCGLPPPLIELPGPAAGGGRMTIPTAGTQDSRGRRPWMTVSAAALTLVLMVAAAAVRLDRLAEESARLDDSLRIAMAEAGKADRLREEIDALSREIGGFLDRKRNTPPLLAVLNELARLLPDHTWAQELHLRGAEVRISGQSASAAGLVELIEYSPMFRKANFTSPITRNPNEDKERFHLVFEVERLQGSTVAARPDPAPAGGWDR